jgi:CubicO group peptidase (beta-lactamase class C family)
MLYTLFVLLALATPEPLHEARDARLEKAIDAYARAYVDAGHLAGQVVVARRGTIIAERNWGLANRETGTPIDSETEINIASITKPMTWTVAHQLIAEGRLAESDSIGKWIPGFHSGRGMTVGHLLTHQAGIPHRVTTEAEESQLMQPADVVELARKAELQFDPGSKASYSSAGYTVLARVLELASDMLYGELLRQRLFEPLGMTHTFHPDSRAIMKRRASSYIPGLAGIENAPLKDMSFLAGAGSVYSTARDLLRFVNACVSGRLGEERRAVAVQNGKLDWNGSSNGFRAFATYDSASGVAIVYCGNVTTGAGDRLKDAIPRLVAGETLAPGALPAVFAHLGARRAIRPEAIKRFEGAYQLFNGQRIDLRVRGDVLAANDWILVPTSESTFFSLRDYADVVPVRGEDGRLVRFDWTINGKPYPLTRLGDLTASGAAQR